MATIGVTILIQMRDKLVTAYLKLAEEGVSSYSIGDQNYTLRDTGRIMTEIERLDRMIALKTQTLGGSRGRNRIDLSRFNG
jgi:hypothetical protein